MNKGHRRLDTERYFTGDLDKSDREEFERHLTGCTECREYLDFLGTERKTFLSVHPFSALSINPPIPARSNFTQRLIDWFSRPALIPAYAFLLLAFLVTPFLFERFAPTVSRGEMVRYKGAGPVWFVYKRNGTVHDGDLAGSYFAGDTIQVLYTSRQRQFVSLLSLDRSGAVSFYDPDPEARICSVPAGTGSSLEFPGSIVLDNSQGEELVIAVFTAAPLSRSAAVEWVRSKMKTAGNDMRPVARALTDSLAAGGGRAYAMILTKGNRR